MYKKITHTIVEEHFDHPIANKIKSSIDKNFQRSKVPTSEVFDTATFRNNVNSYFTNYANYVTKILDSMTGTEEDLITAFESAFTMVDSIGDMMHPLYATEFGERLNTDLRTWLILTTIGTQAAKVNQDNMFWANRFSQIGIDMANNLSYHNNFFTFLAVRQLADDVVKAITDKFNAKKAKNSTADLDATTRIANSIKQLGSTLAEGTMQRYPERFTARTMAVESTACPPAPTPAPAPM